MDRDEALRLAISQARHVRRIRMVYKYSEGWYVDQYTPSNKLVYTGDADTIRYILPNGEVTKLS